MTNLRTLFILQIHKSNEIPENPEELILDSMINDFGFSIKLSYAKVTSAFIVM